MWNWEQAPKEKLDETNSLGKDILVNFSPNGKLLATTGTQDGIVSLRNLSTGRVEELQAGETQIVKLKFSPNGKHLLTAFSNNTIRLWNLEAYSSLPLLRKI